MIRRSFDGRTAFSVRATFPNGFARDFPIPAGREPLEFAHNAFAHSRLAKVELCDASGPCRVISHTGEIYK